MSATAVRIESIPERFPPRRHFNERLSQRITTALHLGELAFSRDEGRSVLEDVAVVCSLLKADSPSSEIDYPSLMIRDHIVRVVGVSVWSDRLAVTDVRGQVWIADWCTVGSLSQVLQRPREHAIQIVVEAPDVTGCPAVSSAAIERADVVAQIARPVEATRVREWDGVHKSTPMKQPTRIHDIRALLKLTTAFWHSQADRIDPVLSGNREGGEEVFNVAQHERPARI